MFFLLEGNADLQFNPASRTIPFLRQKLQGDKSVQGYVLSLVDDTHPATAKPLNDAIVRNGLTNQGRLALCAMLGAWIEQVNESWG